MLNMERGIYLTSFTRVSGSVIIYANDCKPFKITTHTYKRLEGHDFLVDIFVPKNLLEDDSKSKSHRPVAIRFHGGWLVR